MFSNNKTNEDNLQNTRNNDILNETRSQLKKDPFQFNAPQYYDLTDPDFEAEYVNNADGYFNSEETILHLNFDSDEENSKEQEKERVKDNLTEAFSINLSLSKQPQVNDEKNESKEITIDNSEYFKENNEEMDEILSTGTQEDCEMLIETNQNQSQTVEKHDTLEIGPTPNENPEIDTEILPITTKLPSEMMNNEERVSTAWMNPAVATIKRKDSENSSEEPIMHKKEKIDGKNLMDTHKLSITTKIQDNGKEYKSKIITKHDTIANSSRHSQKKPPRTVSSRLFQPTASYLARQEAIRVKQKLQKKEEAWRKKPMQLTVPTSPQFHTKRPHLRQMQPILSSTSREIEQIEKERLEMLQEKEKHERYRQRVLTHTSPAIEGFDGRVMGFERSNKQLTIPESPHLHTKDRAILYEEHHQHMVDESHEKNSNLEEMKQLNEHMSSLNMSSTSLINVSSPHGYLKPEEFLSREHSFSFASNLSKEKKNHLTVAHSPQLYTSLRAQSRKPLKNNDEESATIQAHEWKPTLTQPQSPSLHTTIRAKLNSRPVVKPHDEDEEELKKQFHARPVNRRIFESKPLEACKIVPKKPLTIAKSPALATVSRSRPVEVTHDVAANGIVHRRGLGKSKSKAALPIHSLNRHQAYQEAFAMRLREEAEKEKAQREFRARPMPVTTDTPAYSMPTSQKPLTEIEAFHMPGEEFYQRSKQKKIQLEQEMEHKIKEEATVKARLMPDLDQLPPFIPIKSTKPLTELNGPLMASDIQAKRRKEFDLKEKLRREKEEQIEKERKEMEDQQEAIELAQLRKALTFKAQPIRGTQAYRINPSTKELTIPQSPAFHSHSHSHRPNIQD